MAFQEKAYFLTVLTACLYSGGGSAFPAEEPACPTRFIRAIPIADSVLGPPAGLAYLPEADAFLAARREQGNVPGTAGLRVALVNLLGDMLASAAALRNPQGMSTAWITISDAPHLIAFDWRAATAAGANDGSLALSIDGVPAGTVTGVDNDTLRIDRIRLGAVSEMDLGTRGTYYFDAFESRR